MPTFWPRGRDSRITDILWRPQNKRRLERVVKKVRAVWGEREPSGSFDCVLRTSLRMTAKYKKTEGWSKAEAVASAVDGY
jgi:hypothetical protein